MHGGKLNAFKTRSVGLWTSGIKRYQLNTSGHFQLSLTHKAIDAVHTQLDSESLAKEPHGTRVGQPTARPLILHSRA